MKAIVCPAFGNPDVLRLGDMPRPQPGPGTVLVRVRAAGVNYADLVVIAGKYQVKSEPPFVPGMEIAGEIEEVGEDVEGWMPGERVVALLDGGGYAEFALAPAARLLRLDPGLGFETGAATFINYATAFGALHWRGRLAAGETCLVLGGSGGVGLAAIVLAKAAGARVIGAASSPERASLMTEHGADESIDYSAESLRDRVMELTSKRGVDLVVDPVGGEMGGLALRCIGWGGRIVTLGFPGGSVPSYPANVLLVKNASALGLFFGSYLEHAPQLVREAAASLQAGLGSGAIPTYRIQEARLEELPDLLERIRSRQMTGKAVVKL